MSDVLANQASTFSKSHRFWSGDPAWEPKAIVRGKGARLLGSDGRWYLDFVSGLGAVACGYPTDDTLENTPANVWARNVGWAAWLGAGYSLPHTSEAQVADRLTALLSSHVPGWQHEPLGLRWVKTGSDACEAAVRLARAYTGRRRIISVGYHGWHASFVRATPPAHGIPDNPISHWWLLAQSYGDAKWLHQSVKSAEDEDHDPVAAIIIEQPPQTVPDGYWREVQRICKRFEVLLIVDEVVTGFRYALGGACERFGIEPDMVCVGKALGNGLPIAAIVGRRDIFTKTLDRTDPVFISSTSFGDAVSLAGASAVLDIWDQAAVDHIWKIGGKLMDGLRVAGYDVSGYPPVSLINHPTDSHRAYFIREMAKRGILMNRPNIPNLAHTVEDAVLTIYTAAQVKALMDATDVEAEMVGKLPAVLFRNR